MFLITGTRFCKAGFHNAFFSFLFFFLFWLCVHLKVVNHFLNFDIVICFSYYMSKETNICENLEHDIVAR